jgi:Protein of unknown function (DUF2786)
MTDSNPLLERVRKLLAKAEAAGVTPAEAEALTAKAAELMARYGIDRALLAAAQPETDRPDSKIIDIPNPWAQVQGHLLAGLAAAMRCHCVILTSRQPGSRIHIFGYGSDIERTEVLFTSVLVQMWHGLVAMPLPPGTRSPRAWRRSWLLGFATAVIGRVRAAENKAAADPVTPAESSGHSVALVLADRKQIIKRAAEQAYPNTRKSRVSYSGSGYRDGYAKGQQADLGGPRLTPGARRALGGGRR